MEPYRRSSRYPMIMDQRMEDSACRVNWDILRPLFFLLFWQSIESRPLMGKHRVTPIFRNFDYVIPNMAEYICAKWSVIVPLRPHTIDALIRIIAESKDIFIKIFRVPIKLVGSCGVHTMCAMHLFCAPKFTREYLLVSSHYSLVSENYESSFCHYLL